MEHKKHSHPYIRMVMWTFIVKLCSRSYVEALTPLKKNNFQCFALVMHFSSLQDLEDILPFDGYHEENYLKF